MTTFQIGKIDGRWRNFLPPIQGGEFKTYVERESRVEPEYEDLSSSQGSTPPESPLFDAIGGARRRRNQNLSGLSEVSSFSSISSMEEMGQNRNEHRILPSVVCYSMASDAWQSANINRPNLSPMS